MSVCPKCGKQVDADQGVCPSCGSSIYPSVSTANPYLSNPLARSRKKQEIGDVNDRKCPTCGSTVPFSSATCQNCGAWVGGGATDKTEYNTGFMVAAGVLTAISAVFSLALFVLFLVLFVVATPESLTGTVLEFYTAFPAEAVNNALLLTSFVCLLSLSWLVPSVFVIFKRAESGERISIAFKLFALVFINIPAGICLFLAGGNVK